MKFKNQSRLDSESSLTVSVLKRKKSFAALAGHTCRLLGIALPLCASLQAQASGPLMPVHFRVGAREVLCKSAPLADDGETYVPLEALAAIGLEGKPDGKGEIAHVTQLSTHHSQDLAIARPNGKSMLLLSDIARMVNAHVVRTEVMGRDNRPIAGSKGDTVYLLARLTDVRFQSGTVRVTTSFPVPYRAHMVTSEKVLQGMVECIGAEVPSDFHPAPPTANSGDKTQPLNVKIRAQQYSIDTAHVAIELPAGIVLQAQDKTINPSAIIFAEISGTQKRVARNAPKIKSDAAAQTPKTDKVVRVVGSELPKVNSSGLNADSGERTAVQTPGSPNSANTNGSEKTAASAIQTPTPPDDGSGNTTPPDTAPKKPGVVGSPTHTSLRSQSPSRGGNVKRNSPIEISSLTLVPDTDTHVRLDIATSNAAGTFIHYLPGGKLAVDIPNAMLHLPEGMDTDQTLSHPLLNGIHAELLQDSPPLTRITCDTARIVGFTVTNQSNNKISVDMRLPRNATGALADKVIVVDAGHGGSSTGATAGGFQEKNITLQIALKLREALEACGAKVVMTRDKDVDVDLSDRPNLANDIHADLFVSVHNDSFTSDCRGTSTYYHMSDPSSRALANVVAQTVAGVSGIPSKGALSDGILYNSGLAVLRQSKMPAILVEVAYISNTQDRRKLIDQEFQQRVANAICDGLRTYVEGGTQRGGRRMGMDNQDAPPIPGDTLENTKTLMNK